MKQYHLANNIIGWLIGLIACTVYIMTAEATASWWDCGEYIATAYKLQVGHPPGAPTFQLIGRLFSMFSSPETAAHAVNVMSAVCSGMTILFLFWAITMLGKHLLPDPKNPSLKDWRTWAVFAAGIVGSLAYTFSDTFWFSAVEGEVYAMSSFFTALVFWAILKWEEQSDDPHSLRWLILISLLVGVAIGVHLLNLLTVPAIFYVVYFKKWEKTTVKGFIITGLLSVLTLGIILWGIIPGIVNVDSAVDVLFVNTFHLPFNSGTIFFFTLLAALVVWGLWYTQKKGHPVINAAVLSFAMLVIGYSTFFVLVIRANTNTPLNENAPKDAVSMRAYLGREQYGDTPLLTGQFYTAGLPIDAKQGYTKYVRGTDEKGRDRYIPAAYAQKYIYKQEHTGFFPRMWSSDTDRQHPRYYEFWAGKTYAGQKPTMGQNMTFFHRYQMGWMYWRYFMWNFAGRQNDDQGHYFNDDGTRDYMRGNWISGIKFLDEARLGPQDQMPDHMANDKSRNVYYLLPLILGIIGLVYHIRRHPKDAFIVFIMFFMTGLAIAIYLNMPPRQPRERDYAFVGSFSFFAIWIGLGVMALTEWLTLLFKNNREKMGRLVLPVVFVLCMAGVPCLMAAQNWDDHDRSEKTAARDFAENYLKNIGKNGILITFGDNDTFPLWYVQEVEGTRTDVRILNYTLSGMSWYVEQLFNKLYDSDPLPFTLTKDFYSLGNDRTYIMDRSEEYLEVDTILALMRDNPDRFTMQDQRSGEKIIVLPTKRFKITLDIPALVAKGVIPADMADRVNPVIRWEIKKQVLYRHELMLLDIIGTNKFMRDLNIMNPGSSRIPEIFPPIYRHTIQDGMNYKFIPYEKTQRFTDNSADYFLNGVDGQPLRWGNLDRAIYIDPVSRQQFVPVLHQTLLVLASDESRKGNNDKARRLLDLFDKNFPEANFPVDFYYAYLPLSGDNYIDVISLYNDVYGRERATSQWQSVFNRYRQELNYLSRFRGEKAAGVRLQMRHDLQVLALLRDQARDVLQSEPLVKEVEALMTPYSNLIYN
ncbi:MAG: DUF2723 domain-containing protein [Bacteroidales bacterium]|nr:DUF2723 domain-containing protein [Bacteroidales bacterium]